MVDALYMFSFPFWELFSFGEWSLFMYDDHMRNWNCVTTAKLSGQHLVELRCSTMNNSSWWKQNYSINSFWNLDLPLGNVIHYLPNRLMASLTVYVWVASNVWHNKFYFLMFGFYSICEFSRITFFSFPFPFYSQWEHSTKYSLNS